MKLSKYLSLIMVLALIIGFFLGGISGYLLAPKSDYSGYIATIANLESEIAGLEVTIAKLQQKLAESSANISKYQIEVSQLEIKILELKAQILEFEAQSISGWQYKQLEDAYFNLKERYDNLSEAYNRIHKIYYNTQDDRNWSEVISFNGSAGDGGVLNQSTNDFYLDDRDVRIRWDYRSDLYNRFELNLTGSGENFELNNNYETVAENGWIKRITYTRIEQQGNYHLKFHGEYMGDPELINGTEIDYIITVYEDGGS
jgi:uncharacterized coiled-coil protein SlyX